MIDNKAINKLTGRLKEIMELELKAGNKVVETFEGDWPLPGSIMIFLDKPFKTPVQLDLEDIKFRNINDPHYWKAEYSDIKNHMWLCCRFDGPDFEPL